MESVTPYLLAIVPTIGVGALFYFVIKSILEGDRRERLAQARWEAAHDRHAATGSPSGSSTGSPAAAPTPGPEDPSQQGPVNRR